jgi:hypothetical protein
MQQPDRSKQLSTLLAQRRRELSQRLDISQRMRDLTRSSSLHPIPSAQPRRSPALTTALVALGASLLLACVLAATAVAASGFWFQGQLNDPPTTVENFYSALHHEDYARAYGYLSKAARQHTPQQIFAQQFTSLDDVAGVVEEYSIVTTTASGANATVTASVVRRGDSQRAQIETLNLVSEGGSWRIQSYALGDGAPPTTP